MPDNLDEVLDDLLFNIKFDPRFVLEMSLSDMIRIQQRGVRYQERHKQ
ncbi:hypothetical protein [Paraburkholderia sp. UCT2]|nr:hypothetical protein [Paraburkholderia sp. UCT2]